jgi:disulfide bond formation protein DsbB
MPNMEDERRLPPELPGDDAAAKRAQSPVPEPSGEGVGKWRWLGIGIVGWLITGFGGLVVLVVVLAFIAQLLIANSGGH